MLKHIRKDARRKAGAEGFTLIELLVVIVILGILAAVVVIAVGQIQDRGTENACKTEAKAVEAASALFYSDNRPDYAADVAELQSTGYMKDTTSEFDGATPGYDYDNATGTVDTTDCTP